MRLFFRCQKTSTTYSCAAKVSRRHEHCHQQMRIYYASPYFCLTIHFAFLPSGVRPDFVGVISFVEHSCFNDSVAHRNNAFLVIGINPLDV